MELAHTRVHQRARESAIGSKYLDCRGEVSPRRDVLQRGEMLTSRPSLVSLGDSLGDLVSLGDSLGDLVPLGDSLGDSPFRCPFPVKSGEAVCSYSYSRGCACSQILRSRCPSLFTMQNQYGADFSEFVTSQFLLFENADAGGLLFSSRSPPRPPLPPVIKPNILSPSLVRVASRVRAEEEERSLLLPPAPPLYVYGPFDGPIASQFDVCTSCKSSYKAPRES